MDIIGWLAKTAGAFGMKRLEEWLSKRERLEQEIYNMREQEALLKAKIHEFESFERLKSKYRYSTEEGVYWHMEDESGPYCPLCLDVDHRIVHLVPFGNGFYHCGMHPGTSFDLRKLHRMPGPVYPMRRRSRVGY
jgi:hypothetical protein